LRPVTLKGLSGRVSLVISDVCMPGLGGGCLSRRIKELFPQIPVVLISGNPGSDDLTASDWFLSKPFYPAALLQAIQPFTGPRQRA